MTVDEIFSAFGGPTKTGKVMGVTRTHAATMRSRGSIPPEYWPRLVDGAATKLIEGVTYEALAKIAEGRRREPANSSEVA